MRLKFARKIRRKLPKDFWTKDVEFYLDGASFTHKMNPFDQARAPRAMAWRKPGQGLDFGFTAKGRHEGTGGSVAHFMETTTCGKNLIAAEQYFGRINADTFSSFIHEHLTSMFKKCPNTKGNFFSQDRDPSQNSFKAKSAWDKIGARRFPIPACSLDLNPIKNIFYIIKKKLHQDVEDMKIERKDFEEFSARVKATLESIPGDVVGLIVYTHTHTHAHTHTHTHTYIYIYYIYVFVCVFVCVCIIILVALVLT